MWRKQWVVSVFLLLFMLGVGVPHAAACGGLFCQNVPVDQNAERIIFTDNGDGTISAYIQIQYTGSAPGFSWILPLPVPITAEDIAIPEDAMTAFTELETLTNPVFIPPVFPDCAEVVFESVAMSDAADDGGVAVFASGEVGPFGFDVIGSEDPAALITWLRTNGYTVEEQMEPLINLYVEEKFVFLAMKLLPESDVQDIEPIKITYPTEKPMIPLRLTAVAANPDMAVLVWFYGSSQYVPENFAHMEVKDEDITFFTFGGNDYRALMGRTADEYDGKAFVTEFAGPANTIAVTHPLLVELGQKHAYLTRLNTVISPEEMTVDPVFKYDTSRADVSNIHDLSGMTGLYDCEREEASSSVNFPFFTGGSDDSNANSGTTTDSGAARFALPAIALVAVCLFGMVGGGLVMFGMMRMRRK